MSLNRTKDKVKKSTKKEEKEMEKLLRFSTKKLEYLNQNRIPVFKQIDTNRKSFFRFLSFWLYILLTKMKSSTVVPRTTNINFGAPQE
jgi:hypothetical protein